LPPGLDKKARPPELDRLRESIDPLLRGFFLVA
jgi:hypothetical protein